MAEASFGRVLSLILRTFPGTRLLPPHLHKLHVSSPVTLLRCVHPQCHKGMFLTPMRDADNRPYHQICKYEAMVDG